jgi:hypothetical protein
MRCSIVLVSLRGIPVAKLEQVLVNGQSLPLGSGLEG